MFPWLLTASCPLGPGEQPGSRFSVGTLSFSFMLTNILSYYFLNYYHFESDNGVLPIILFAFPFLLLMNICKHFYSL